jgi:hypothetical protein
MPTMTTRDNRQENNALMIPQKRYNTTRAKRNSLPQIAKPTATRTNFNQIFMLIGRIENRVSLFFSIVFIISDIFFCRIGAGCELSSFGCLSNEVFRHGKIFWKNTLALLRNGLVRSSAL